MKSVRLNLGYCSLALCLLSGSLQAMPIPMPTVSGTGSSQDPYIFTKTISSLETEMSVFPVFQTGTVYIEQQITNGTPHTWKGFNWMFMPEDPGDVLPMISPEGSQTVETLLNSPQKVTFGLSLDHLMPQEVLIQQFKVEIADEETTFMVADVVHLDQTASVPLPSSLMLLGLGLLGLRSRYSASSSTQRYLWDHHR